MKSLLVFFKKDKKTALAIFLLILLFCLGILQSQFGTGNVLSSTDEILNVQLNINPELDFSLFTPYSVIASSVPENAYNVQLNLSVKTGNENTCWDFYVDGTCASQPMTFNMTYDSGTNTYNRTIYPDQIYPEILFASSSITWGNTPLNTPIRRNDYHILHLANPFTMVDDMSFWIEVNSVPTSVANSADLQVYLVEKGYDISYFNSDWMKNEGTELVGTFPKNSVFSHTHSINTSHHLVRLATNSDGTVGNKHIDISDDFWLVYYSNSPNNSRGWNLRYHPNTLCNNENRWYRGNISGWETTSQQGCPDSHIHISRRNIEYTDSVEASVTATYSTGTFSSNPIIFSFNELPNLAPNASAFATPVVGSRYSGNLGVSWNPSTDPNATDTIGYTIYITKVEGTQTTLLENSSNTSYTLDTTLYENGEYTLQGEVCDNLGLCTSFATDGSFYIDNIVVPETISSVSISSSNSNSTWAKNGDTISISFVTSGTIPTPNIDIYSGGESVNDTIDITNPQPNTWVVSYQIASTDTDGQITFVIYSTNLDRAYYETTNQTKVTVDLTPPFAPTASLSSGEYTGAQEMTLQTESNSNTRFTLDGSAPTCNTGVLYETLIPITVDTTLKAISCDALENSSNIVTYGYEIKEYISSITVSSSNMMSTYAKDGDTITLSFIASNIIQTPTVLFNAGGEELLGDVKIVNSDITTWTVEYEVLKEDSNGLLSFSITSPTLYTVFTETTDLSRVTIDTQPPISPISNTPSGIYPAAQKVLLLSSLSSLIRYTLDGSIPSCSSGYLYNSYINIVTSHILKAVSCDLAGNISTLAIYTITIFPDTYIIDEQDIDSQKENDTDIPQKDDSYQKIDNLTYTTLVTRIGDETLLSVLKVRLIDSINNPIKNTEVTIYSKPQSARSGLDGILTFFDIPVDTHTLLFTYEGEKYKQKIVLEEPNIGGITNLKVVDVKIEKKEKYTYIIALVITTSLLTTYLIAQNINKKKNYP